MKVLAAVKPEAPVIQPEWNAPATRGGAHRDKPEPQSLRHLRYRPKPAALTMRQFMVLQLLACGLADKEIAGVINVQIATVKHHASRLIRIFGLHRRQQLVRYVFENGFFDPEAVERLLRNPEHRRGPGARISIPAHLGSTGITLHSMRDSG